MYTIGVTYSIIMQLLASSPYHWSQKVPKFFMRREATAAKRTIWRASASLQRVRGENRFGFVFGRAWVCIIRIIVSRV